MLKNEYLDAKIGVDTDKNEPSKVLLSLFDFHTHQGFNLHIRIPPLACRQEALGNLLPSVSEGNMLQEVAAPDC